jgi:hypothetical protein
MAANLETAIQIATEAHEGQTRFDGSPYINHPLRVMEMMRVQGHSERGQIVGVLHDAVEDSELTFDDLRRQGFNNDVVYPLQLLTKPEDEEMDYLGLYIPRIAVNACSRAAKKCDLFDNLDLTGLQNPSLERIENIEKYGKALLYLARFPQPRV